MLDKQVTNALLRVAGEDASITQLAPLAGGSINRAFAVEFDRHRSLFIKIARTNTHCPGMFIAEARALRTIANSNTICVPDIYYADEQCLIQSLFEHQPKASNWYEQLGHDLALMHQAIRSPCFGDFDDNYLGTSPQRNSQCNDWEHFWCEYRLRPQISTLCEQLGFDDKLIALLDTLSVRLNIYLGGWTEPPVFVHGDLWSGNAAAVEGGRPIIFDPASYFASREVEFGMMRLFGGFGQRTEAAYQEVWPFEADSDARIELYRLYHLLNHLILFGGAYYADAVDCVSRLV